MLAALHAAVPAYRFLLYGAYPDFTFWILAVAVVTGI
jgi:hypothetical protein